MADRTNSPPLSGLRVIELAGLAPAPFAGLLLADYGASVLRIDRPHPSAHSSTDSPPPTTDQLTRHKASICVDLKSAASRAILLSLLSSADVLIDPYRPGVLEKSGLAPETLLQRNPRLIVARLTGFRRDGPYAKMAGHDINYLAISGVLSHLGRAGSPPHPPVNLLADFAGGGLMCVFGILMALLSRDRTGKGQVVEANMADGAAYLATFLRLGRNKPLMDRPRGENMLDGGSPFYGVYECRDGGYMAVGALEPQFFAILVERLGLEHHWNKKRADPTNWPELRRILTDMFQSRSRTEWESVFEGCDACVTPVLTQHELEKQGYEQALAVGLTETPGKKIDQKSAWEGTGLPPGSGGEDILQDWVGLRRGRDYDVVNGALVQKIIAKL